jgi:hypothetical protein
MYIEKLDGRYKWHRQGFQYRLAFGIRDITMLNQWMSIQTWLEKIYGKEYLITDTGHRLNDHYRTDMPSKRCRQVYLRNEQDITMMLLMVGGHDNRFT